MDLNYSLLLRENGSKRAHVKKQKSRQVQYSSYLNSEGTDLRLETSKWGKITNNPEFFSENDITVLEFGYEILPDKFIIDLSRVNKEIYYECN